ncbi:unnamed protein product, partial [Protopolystoma xenopodis]
IGPTKPQLIPARIIVGPSISESSSRQPEEPRSDGDAVSVGNISDSDERPYGLGFESPDPVVWKAEDNETDQSLPKGSHIPIGSLGYWLAGLHLYAPLPKFGNAEGSYSSMLRLHSFAMAGGTIDNPVIQISNCLSSTNPPGRLISTLLDFPRIVLGAGIVVRFSSFLRAELNYCLPLLSQPGDRVCSGFQFGAGIHYM